MERHSRAPDFVDQFLTGRLELFQIGRTKLRIGCPRKNQIRHFQIAHRPVIGRRLRIDLFRDPKRGFAHFIVRPDVSHDCRINSIAENYERVVARFRRITSVCERTRNHDVGIGRADEKAEFLERGHFRAQLRNRVAQIALSVGGRGSRRELIFGVF